MGAVWGRGRGGGHAAELLEQEGWCTVGGGEGSMRADRHGAAQGTGGEGRAPALASAARSEAGWVAIRCRLEGPGGVARLSFQMLVPTRYPSPPSRLCLHRSLLAP